MWKRYLEHNNYKKHYMQAPKNVRIHTCTHALGMQCILSFIQCSQSMPIRKRTVDYNTDYENWEVAPRPLSYVHDNSC